MGPHHGAGPRPTKQAHVGTLTGSTDVALTAVAADRVHTGRHVTLTSQQTDSVAVQVLLKRGANQYRLHRVGELGTKDSVSFPLAHTLAAADPDWGAVIA